MKTKKYWVLLGGVLMATFAILGFYGSEVYRQAPPIPETVVNQNGETLLTKDDILTGQQVWQSTGGQQLGSVWGHGAYQAPDWTADWLHREILAFQELAAQKHFSASHGSLDAGEKAQIKDLALKAYREAAYNPKTKTLTLDPLRAQAFLKVKQHYKDLFGGSLKLRHLREDYAMQEDVLKTDEQRELFSKFIFWTSWAASAKRPGEKYTYTNNWPHEPLIDNVPTTANVFWSILSVILLLAGLGALVWYNSFKRKEHGEPKEFAQKDPMEGLNLTPSMKSLWKYVFTIAGLFLFQVLLGGLLAHYTVEGQHFYGFPLADYLPYSLIRTWHIQAALFWIATAFLAAGLFLAPIINGGQDPKHQTLGINILFGALLLVVVGSMAGEYLAIHHKLSLDYSFWFGHQGYEYTDLGRVWQIALLIGLCLWLVLMLRAIVPALKLKDEGRHILAIFTGATTAIGLFYAAGLFYGAKTHISIMEYWRWWVVHLWVEGFFEVFATAALAFVFYKLGLVRSESATRNVLLGTSIFLVGGIPGTFHHLYFSGTPISITAIGACFSALEVVPLVLIGQEAWETYRTHQLAPWAQNYRWPVMFFTGVAFWNLVGAGLLGFLINPPIALYYMQGLNTTASHAHGATFGVYGLLSLGLVLLILRKLTQGKEWNTNVLRLSFWSLNAGLALMIGMSLLPIGLLQTWASVETGLWFARSSEFLQTDLIEYLRWARIFGDAIFTLGTASFVWFVIGLKFGWSYQEAPVGIADPEPAIFPTAKG